GSDEHQLVRGAAGEPFHRASKRATLFAPGAGAPTRRRQRKDGSSSPIAARGLEVPRQRVPPGRSAPALRQPEPVQPREGRAPARPWCSGGRARPSSQQARYAVRTRGRVLLQGDARGKLAHRVRSRPVGSTFPGNVYPPGRSAPALRQPEPVQPWDGRAPARPPLTPQPTPTAAESPPLPAPPPQTPVTAPEAQARPTGTQATSPSRHARPP